MTKKVEKKLPVLYLVAPCFNEENVLPITYTLFTDKLKQLIKEKITAIKTVLL